MVYKMRKKNFYKKSILAVGFIFGVALTGCSPQEKIEEGILSLLEEEQTEEVSDTAEQSNVSSSKENEADLSQDLEKGVNGDVFGKLQKLERLAKEYKEKDSTVTDSESLLVMQYLRSVNSNYTTTEWNMLAGTPDRGFEAYVEANADQELISFREEARILDPATGEEIEFSHLVASINLAVVQKEIRESGEVESFPYVDYGSWGGDLLQLCSEIKSEGLDSSQWSEEMAQRIGNENSGFNRDDLYADLDACNLEAIFESQKGIAQAFYEYYYEILENSSTTRYQYFYENHFSGEKDVEALSTAMSNIILDKESIIMQNLLSMQGLDIDADAYLISTGCEVFAQKVIDQQKS